MRKLICFSVLLATLGCSLFASDAQENLKEGIRYHDLAQTTPEPNIEKGKALLAPLQNDYPLAKGYYGSLITLEAGCYVNQKKMVKALGALNEGTKLIDEAVNSAPNMVDLRFLRMINSYELSKSSPKNRYKIMKIDIDWLEANKAMLSPANIGLLDLYNGLYLLKAHKADEALASFDACIAVSPGSPEAIEAQKQKEKTAE